MYYLVCYVHFAPLPCVHEADDDEENKSVEHSVIFYCQQHLLILH